VDLRAIPEESYGAALYYFTGSKAHNIATRKLALARKLKINEYGVFRGAKRVAGRTEEELFQVLGLAYIPPELREDRGEIAAARERRLPTLIILRDIRGDLHSHTDATDGRDSLAEMAAAAQAHGYGYLAITDHSRQVSVAHGMDKKRLLAQIKAIDKLNAAFKGFRLLKSLEVDILEDGSLDMPDMVLKELDLVVGAIHYKQYLPAAKQTARLLKAMDNRYFNILAHPTGRLINERQPMDYDLERVMRGAKQRGCCLEVDSQPDRLDLDDVHCKLAKDVGVRLAISSDAHSTDGLGLMRFGVDQARRGWLEPADVLNTLSLEKLLQTLRR
jgi:DNA polymerase (family 10)